MNIATEKNMNIQSQSLDPALLDRYRFASEITVVCSDYFDTLVSRVIHPEDVKRQWAERLSHIFDLQLTDGLLYARRAQIEIILCKRNQSAGKDPEFNVIECYEALWEGLDSQSRPACDAFVALSRELELSIECAVQRLDEQVVAFLRKAQEAGQRIILVSDFYFPAQMLQQMLAFHGIAEIFEQVFVSADSLLTKRSGRAFPMILEALNIRAEQALMLGDNPEADCRQPQAQGMQSIWLDRTLRHAAYTEMAKIAADRRITEKEIESCLNSDNAAVFPELALTLFTFTERLYAWLLGKGVKDVFFLAREGQFLKQLFDLYQHRRAATPAMLIRSHYLEVSRRATFLPSLGPLVSEDFEILFRQYRRISGEEFLLNLGLEALLHQLESELPAHKFKMRQDDFPNSSIFKAILSSPLFVSAYEQARTQSREAMLAYQDSFARLGDNATVTLVDVGWKGTIQDNLHRVYLGAKAEENRFTQQVDGIYLGLVSAGEAGPGNMKKGLLFSALDGWTRHYAAFNENRALYEVMLAADHGSAAGYQIKSDGSAEAVLGEFSEQALFESRVKPEQVRLLRAFERVDELLFHRYYSDTWLLSVTARHHARMVFSPSHAEIVWFMGVFHVENFGVFEHSRFENASNSVTWYSRLKFAWRLWRQRGRVDLGFWPWLACLQRGGSFAARAYRMYRLR